MLISEKKTEMQTACTKNITQLNSSGGIRIEQREN